jgi:hypothetical protein
MLFRAFGLAIAITGVIVACGSANTPNFAQGDGGPRADGTLGSSGSTGSSGNGQGSGDDASSSGQGGSSGLPGAGAGQAGGTIFFDGAPPDTGVLCGPGGQCGCPPYEQFCNGACVVTNLDPQNCGACGRACPAGQACSSGVCSANCTTTPNGGDQQILKCGPLCVDKWTDNKNCGACGNDCTANNQVCVGGMCVARTIQLADAGVKSCPFGGPITDITVNGSKTCVGTLAQTTFRWGLCTCGRVQLVNSGQPWGPPHGNLNFPALYIDAYDSSKGPWDWNNPQIGGSLGVNGPFASPGGAFTFVTGHMWAAAALAAGGMMDVKQELHAVGPVTENGGPFHVGQPNPALVNVVPGTAAWDGYVLGNVNGPITFHKDLYQPAGAGTGGGVVVNGMIRNMPPFTVPPPCDACGTSQIPIGTIVDQWVTTNDNATIGLNPAAMTGLTGTTRLDLPCGYYYLNEISSTGSVAVYAHGHTALFIGGNVTGFQVSFTLDPGGTFDVFIKGTINATSNLVIGNPNYAALTRVYVGAPTLGISGEAHFAGLFYAANADIALTSHITAYGALYCNNFLGQGDNTDIHYDRAALAQGYGCDVAPAGCKTCRDCGNQACVNGACVACTSSAQCCPPLICSNGACQ